jgi:hypothetical protein
MTTNSKRRSSLVINWIARIFGLIVVVVFVIFVVGDTIDTMQQGNGFDVESLYIILPIVLALAGYILAWWHKVIGGSLLILVSIILSILIGWATQRFQGPMSNFHALIGWLLLGLPFLITGALYLISAYLDRTNAS